MKHISILIFFLVTLLVVLPVLAQQAGSFDLTWSTVDGGGGESSGSDYTLLGTVGQPDAARLSGGGYSLVGGFWGWHPVPLAQTHSIYLPLIIR
jgi:hypothetical protein